MNKTNSVSGCGTRTNKMHFSSLVSFNDLSSTCFE